IAACSETSFSPTRTARPSSERSYRYRCSCCSNSAGLRTAVVDIEKTLSGARSERSDGRRELVDGERLRDHGVAVDALEPVGAGEHRHLHARMVAAHLVQQLDAVAGAHVQVEDDDVDVAHLCARVVEAAGLAHVPPGELEVDPA